MANQGYPVVNRGASILPYLTWGTQDPTVDGAPGEPGMLYVQIAAPNLLAAVGIFQKIDTAGNDTNWQRVGPNPDGGVTTIGAIDSQTKSANGGVIVGANLYYQTADGSFPGLLSILAQDIVGEKSFQNAIQGKTIITPANPPAGYLKLYFKGDGNLYSLNSAGVETQVGANDPYTPSTPGNWNPVPTTVPGALDQLASQKLEVEERVVTGPEAAAKQVVLTGVPFNVNAVGVAFQGVEQTDSVDFSVSGNIVGWTGLGMDAIGVVAGDILVITYQKG